MDRLREICDLTLSNYPSFGSIAEALEESRAKQSVVVIFTEEDYEVYGIVQEQKAGGVVVIELDDTLSNRVVVYDIEKINELTLYSKMGQVWQLWYGHNHR